MFIESSRIAKVANDLYLRSWKQVRACVACRRGAPIKTAVVVRMSASRNERPRSELWR
jgi:hypothetical protein